MGRSFLILAVGLLVVDAALRTWRPLRARAFHNLVYLGLAWIPLFVLPHLQPRAAELAAAVVALVSMVDFALMVGLTLQLRFFIPTLLMVLAAFPLAAAGLERQLSALPVLALLAIVACGVSSRDARAFLQKLCLAWLSVLVYGYLYAHAVLVVATPRLGATGPALLALIILLAKCADIAWVASWRLFRREGLQLLASPLGGAAGALVLAALSPRLPALTLGVLGLAVGIGLGFGSRAYHLIVTDVVGQTANQRKATMLFGFGLALAVGYWALTLLPLPR